VLYQQNGWRAFAPQRLKTHGIWPNQLLHNHETGEGVLVVQQSPNYEEYAISAGGLDYLLLEQGSSRKANHGRVRGLGEPPRREVARKPVNEVAAQVENLEPAGSARSLLLVLDDLTVQGLTDLF
jgi:hypothetical protein